MICYTYRQVYEYYAKVARFYQNRGLKILKTDTYNESGLARSVIPLGPILDIGNEVTCVELNEDVLSHAKRNFPQLRLLKGDIRNLDQYMHYDLLLDFSTLDHVTPDELPKVLYDYKKVADAVSIIVWLSDTRPSYQGQYAQYFFKNFDFRTIFHEAFGEYKEIILFAEEGASLVHFMNSRSNLVDVMGFIDSVNLSSLSIENKNRAEAEAFRSKLKAPLRPAVRFAWKILNNAKGIYTSKNNPTRYPWEYLEKLNYRYEIVRKCIDFGDLHVVELCSGHTGLYNLVKDEVASYRACDLWKLHPICEQMSDDKFVETVTKCDVLCTFGVSAYEISLDERESKTLTNSIHFLIKEFNPRWVVLESIEKYFPIISNIASQYQYQESLFKHKSFNWVLNRSMLILGPHRVKPH